MIRHVHSDTHAYITNAVVIYTYTCLHVPDGEDTDGYMNLMQISTLMEVYVRIYVVFDEVQKWKGLHDVAEVLP